MKIGQSNITSEKEVCVAADLFEESAASTILNYVINIYKTETEMQGVILDWYLGITGGTMNMAAIGGYTGLLIAMKVFYVIKPPPGGKPMANRDIVEFPQLQGLGWLLHTNRNSFISRKPFR